MILLAWMRWLNLELDSLRASRPWLRQELTVQQEASVQKLRAEMERQNAECEKAAVELAVRNLATKLTGVEDHSKGHP